MNRSTSCGGTGPGMEPIDYWGATAQLAATGRARTCSARSSPSCCPSATPPGGQGPWPWQATTRGRLRSGQQGQPPGRRGDQRRRSSSTQQHSGAEGTAVSGQDPGPELRVLSVHGGRLARSRHVLGSATAPRPVLKQNSATVVVLTGFGRPPTAAVSTANDYADDQAHCGDGVDVGGRGQRRRRQAAIATIKSIRPPAARLSPPVSSD